MKVAFLWEGHQILLALFSLCANYAKTNIFGAKSCISQVHQTRQASGLAPTLEIAGTLCYRRYRVPSFTKPYRSHNTQNPTVQ